MIICKAHNHNPNKGFKEEYQMFIRYIRLSFLFFTCCFIFFIFHTPGFSAPTKYGVKIEEPAPQFSLPAITGKWVSLKDFKGRKILFFQWASWCTCREQLPFLEEFYKKHKSSAFEILTAAIDSQGIRYAKPLYEKAGVTFTALFDQEGLLPELYHFPATPNGFLIDENGIVKYQNINDFDIRKEEIKKTVEDFISAKTENITVEPLPQKPLLEEIAETEEMLKKKPDDILLMRTLARKYSEKGDFASAVKIYQDILAKKTKSAEDAFSLGVAFYNTGDKGNTIKYWEKALRLDPTNYIYLRSIQSLKNPDQFYSDKSLGKFYSGTLKENNNK